VLLSNSSGTTTMELDADEDDAGVMRLFDAQGDATVEIVAAETATNGAQILLHKADGTKTIELDAEKSGRGEISLYHDDGTTETIEIIGAENGTGGQIKLRNSDGTTTITMDAEHGEGGDGRIITDVLEITGGSDLSEQFEINGSRVDMPPSPGMVVSIDPDNTGELIVSNTAYDYTVAGVVSGAGGVKPGMLMGQSSSPADGDYPVALTGRVYCLVDASYGPVKPGDLLTTSDTPGHAMKVSDHGRAQGAIIGKAMSSLGSGTGLVLVLISLQ
jgi:hypothetical protein